MLSKEEILNANDIVIEEVQVPEWGGSVFVRSLSGTDRDAFEQSVVEGKKMNLANIRARLCAKTICDADGERLFTDADVTALGRKSAKALNTVFEVAQGLNGLSTDDVKELEKNSGGGPSEDSTSD